MTDEELEAARLEQERLDAEVAEKEAKLKEASEKQKKEDDGNKPKLSDAEAKLLKELMQHKKAAKEAADKAKSLEDKYSGIDLDALMEAARKAEEAEKAELERKGEYELLKQKMADAHAKELEALKTSLKEAKDLAKAAKQANEAAAAANAFSNSRYVIDNLTLTPNKTKALYGDYFEIENGTVVGYDKPKGSSNRTKLVDGSGEPVGFDEAMKQIIESDPDKDTLIKTNLNPGSGSEGNRGTFRPSSKDKPMTSMDKILQGLKDQKLT